MKWSELGVTKSSQLFEQAKDYEQVANESYLEPDCRERLLRAAKALYDAAKDFEKGEPK